MIEEKAVVVALLNGQAILEAKQKNACQSCELSGGCGTGSLGRLLGHKAQNLSIKNDHKLSVGDRIIIGMPEKFFIYAGFLMYLLPLGFLFIFSLVSNYLFMATEWINVLAALCGLASGLVLTVKLSRNSLSDKLQPRFIRHQLSNKMGQTRSVYPVNLSIKNTQETL